MSSIERETRTFESKSPRSKAIFEKARELTPFGVHSNYRFIDPYPLYFSKAQGSKIWDADGNEFTDFNMGFGALVTGHSHPTLVKEIGNRLEKGVLYGFEAEDSVELGKLVTSRFGYDMVRFSTTGAEATMHAVRLARAHTGREKLLKFEGCYHGSHDSLLVSVKPSKEKVGDAKSPNQVPASKGIPPELVSDTIIAPFNDLDACETLVRKHRDEIAAIILEPIPHNIGCILPQKCFLEGLREITRLNGIILIFDEVITGFRHGLGGYQKICGVTPDLTTLGKAVANGYPISAVCGKRELMDRFNTHEDGNVFFAGTFNGHPISCAAALATVEVLEDEATYAHTFGLGERMRKGLTDIVNRLGIKATVAGFGSVFLTYFMEGPIENYTDLTRNDQEKFVRYRQQMIERGIFKLPMNLKRNHISLSHTVEMVDRTLQAAEDVLRGLA